MTTLFNPGSRDAAPISAAPNAGGSLPSVSAARRGGSTRQRCVVMMVPAAVTTFALFSGMRAMIHVDTIELDEAPQRVLEAFVLPDLVDPSPTSRPRVTKVETVAPPPPPRQQRIGAGDIDLPAVVIEGAAPDAFDRAELVPIGFGPIAIDERDAQPVTPPLPVYPPKAIERGLEGTCEVRFDVSTRGQPYNLTAVCTNAVFEREAIRAVGSVEFLPRIVRGQAVERSNVVYPLEFKLN